MRLILFTRPDGGVTVRRPVRNTVGESLKTDAEIESRAWQKLPADAIDPRWVSESAIPFDRTFRNAWKANGADIVVDMPKARDLLRNKLRELRKPKLEVLDAAYMQADERGDLAEKQRIAAQKQSLRDVTADPMIEAARTPEELRSLIPEVLSVS